MFTPPAEGDVSKACELVQAQEAFSSCLLSGPDAIHRRCNWAKAPLSKGNKSSLKSGSLLWVGEVSIPKQ
jgi:hypothetical protein